MTDCTQTTRSFPPVKRRQVEVNFQGGDVTSNGGVLLLRQADRYLGLSVAVAGHWPTRGAQADIIKVEIPESGAEPHLLSR